MTNKICNFNIAFILWDLLTLTVDPLTSKPYSEINILTMSEAHVAAR